MPERKRLKKSEWIEKQRREERKTYFRGVIISVILILIGIGFLYWGYATPAPPYTIFAGLFNVFCFLVGGLFVALGMIIPLLLVIPKKKPDVFEQLKGVDDEVFEKVKEWEEGGLPITHEKIRLAKAHVKGEKIKELGGCIVCKRFDEEHNYCEPQGHIDHPYKNYCKYFEPRKDQEEKIRELGWEKWFFSV